MGGWWPNKSNNTESNDDYHCYIFALQSLYSIIILYNLSELHD